MRAIIPAAGLGQRMQAVSAGRSKLTLKLNGIPILEYTLKSLSLSSLISHFTIAVSRDEASWVEELAGRVLHDIPYEVVPGGATRQESVACALRARDNTSSDLILVHDGARPFCDANLVKKVSDRASQSGAAIAALPSTATLKRVERGVIAETLDREHIFEAQTPQIVRADLLLEAHARAEEEGYSVTDDAQLLEKLGHAVSIVEGSKFNLKITHPADIPLAEFLIASALVPVFRDPV